MCWKRVRNNKRQYLDKIVRTLGYLLRKLYIAHVEMSQFITCVLWMTTDDLMLSRGGVWESP